MEYKVLVDNLVLYDSSTGIDVATLKKGDKIIVENIEPGKDHDIAYIRHNTYVYSRYRDKPYIEKVTKKKKG